MNTTNRIANRLLLVITGLVLTLGGATLLVGTVRPDWIRTLSPAVGTTLRRIREALTEWDPGTIGTAASSSAAVSSTTVLMLIGGATALLILLVVFVCTRGGGATTTVLRESTPQGLTLVDRAVADAVLAAPIRVRSDVISVRTSSFRVRGAPAVHISVTPRQGARIPGLMEELREALVEWDALTEAATPVVLHVSGRGWLDRWRAATRVR